jgi:glyoxylase I family protein
MRGLVHHIDLTVTDKERSRAFYDAVLGFMGYRRAGEPFHSIGILEACGDGAARVHDRYSPGLHHLAWAADSREDVDALHGLLRSIDATVLDPPADYPQYGRVYYAVFFADPDGLKLEFVFGATGS